MEEETAPEKKRRNFMPAVKGLFFTMMVLAALWFALRHVITPLILPKEAAQIPVPATSQVEERIKTLEQKVAALETKETPAVDIAPFEERIKALENAPKAEAVPAVATINHEEIDALKSEIEKLKSDDHTYVKSILLIGQLQDAVRAGRPFAGELTALISLQPGLKETLTPLVASSATGIATLDGLKQQFAHAIVPALAPKDEGEKSLSKNLRSLVKIRKVGEAQTGKDDQAVIARAEAKLAKGEIAAALQETNTLSPQAEKDFAAWQERAEAYLSAQAIVANLTTALATGLK